MALVPSETVALLKGQAPAMNLPADLVPAFLATVTAAGLELQTAAAQAPAAAIETTPAVRVKCAGMPGYFLAGCKVGTRGWLTWLEVFRRGEPMIVSTPVFVAGDGDLVPASAPEDEGK